MFSLCLKVTIVFGIFFGLFKSRLGSRGDYNDEMLYYRRLSKSIMETSKKHNRDSRGGVLIPLTSEEIERLEDRAPLSGLPDVTVELGRFSASGPSTLLPHASPFSFKRHQHKFASNNARS